MPQVLEGITILDFTRGMPGAIATMVGSDFGAEVIKVEPPGGDPFRSMPGALQWDRGKRSVVLDLKSRRGQAQAQALTRRADVVIESLRPGVTQRLGIDYDTLRALKPDLVYCSITGFGSRGAYAGYKGYEGVVAAKCGRMAAFGGQVDREGPVFSAVQVASHAAALAALRGVVAALYVRDRTGQGQRVETSLLQAITAYDVYHWITWQMMLKDPERFPGDPTLDPSRLPRVGYLPARTRDGQWMQIASLLQPLFQATLRSIGLGHVLEERRFADAPRLLDEDRAELVGMMLSRLQERTLEEWMHFFIRDAADVASEPFMTAQQAMDHPQLRHNGHVTEVQDPRVGPMRQLGPLLLMEETPGSVRGPAPEVGRDTAAVLAGLEESMATAPAIGGAALPGHPLDGVTVLDFSTVIAGPFGGSLMAELGARVIRVETLDGDYMRINYHGLGAQKTMAGTESLSVNLKTEEGQAIIHALVARADAVVHNMRPGAPERIGIGYRQLKEINPRLIYLYSGGYGSTGPYAHRPAMHPIPGALMGGVLAQMGRGAIPPAETPMTLDEIAAVSGRLSRANEPSPDFNTSMVIATGLMMALYARQRFGTAQKLETSLLWANAYANADDFFDYAGKPPRGISDAEGHGPHALYRLYAARQGWVFLACVFEREWTALCRALGRDDLTADARFADATARAKNDEALAMELGRIFAARDAPEWERDLAAADVACVQAEERGMFHFFEEDAHAAASGCTTVVRNRGLGEYWRYSPLIRFSRTPEKAGPGVLKGEHTRAVLSELGYSREDAEALRARGVVAWEEG